MTNNRDPIHPSSIVVVLLLAGLVMLFIALSFAYIYARVNAGMETVQVPVVFYANIGILLLASYQLEQAKKASRQPGANPLLQLVLALCLTIIFLVLQVVGWSMLFRQENFVNTSPGYAYLYALSGLHLLHVLGGLPFLIHHIFLLQGKRKAMPGGDEPSIGDSGLQRRLRLITRYWHFVDALWIYLVVFLLLNTMI